MVFFLLLLLLGLSGALPPIPANATLRPVGARTTVATNTTTATPQQGTKKRGEGKKRWGAKRWRRKRRGRRGCKLEHFYHHQLFFLHKQQLGFAPVPLFDPSKVQLRKTTANPADKPQEAPKEGTVIFGWLVRLCFRLS